jgi:protein-S-isoprenylcysteine O-methyltransferase Ste14
MRRGPLVAIFAGACVGAGVDGVHAASDAMTHPSLRAWLYVGFTALKLVVIIAFTVFVAKRGPARRRTYSPLAFVACATALGALAAVQRPTDSTTTTLLVAGVTLALAATGWMLMSTLALGKCFGLLPEARGLVTRGPYRLVRHPLYLGELAACAGLTLASPSTRNLVLAAVFAAAQAARMRMEERELTREFPEYRSYAARTPRLVPRLRMAGEDGQTLVEYAAILVVVSIVAIGVLAAIGTLTNANLLQLVAF